MLKVVVILCVFFVSSFANFEDLFNDDSKYKLKTACIEKINEQINMEMEASMAYLNMGSYFARNAVAKRGFAKFLFDSSKEEKNHAQMLIDYVNKRGGEVGVIIPKLPSGYEKPKTVTNFVEALEESTKLELNVNENLHKLHDAPICKDHHFIKFLEDEFLAEQIDSIDQLSRLHQMLTDMGAGVGEYLLDRQMLDGKISKDEL